MKSTTVDRLTVKVQRNHSSDPAIARVCDCDDTPYLAFLFSLSWVSPCRARSFDFYCCRSGIGFHCYLATEGLTSMAHGESVDRSCQLCDGIVYFIEEGMCLCQRMEDIKRTDWHFVSHQRILRSS